MINVKFYIELSISGIQTNRFWYYKSIKRTFHFKIIEIDTFHPKTFENLFMVDELNPQICVDKKLQILNGSNENFREKKSLKSENLHFIAKKDIRNHGFE